MLHIIPQSEFEGFTVPDHEVWRYLGYMDASKARPEIQRVFERVKEEVGPPLLEPKACYDIFPIKNVSQSEVELNGVTFHSEDLAERLKGAEEVAIFLSTAGARIGEEAEELIVRGDSVLGYILDVFASAAVDTLAYRVREIIKREITPTGRQAIRYSTCLGKKDCPVFRDCGGVVTKWWSPGYGDWVAVENKKLFSILDGGKIGMRVKESGMMEPRKSYACVMPIGPEGKERPAVKCAEWQKAWTQRGTKGR